jgi:hypothetical protein
MESEYPTWLLKKESLLPEQDFKLGPAGLGLVFYVCEKIQDERCHNLL